MGNDDHIELDSQTEAIRSVHGRRLDMSVYGIVGYQYSPPFIGSCHETPEDEIATDLDKIALFTDNKTVLVTHTPAYGYVDQTYSGLHVGSHALSDWLNRKNVLCHIHGHIHHSFGRSGYHFNVAADGRSRAMIIDLPSLSYSVIEKS
jgi:Icc-related predicted phosphoesterase